MSSRDANTYPELRDIETMVAKLEEIPIYKNEEYGWYNHYLRIRAVYYDDKNDSYSTFVDYIFKFRINHYAAFNRAFILMIFVID